MTERLTLDPLRDMPLDGLAPLKALKNAADEDIVPGVAALEMSRAQLDPGPHPDFPMSAYLRHLDVLVRDVRHYVGNDGDDVALQGEALRRVLAQRYGYTAPRKPTPEDGLLSSAIERRRGTDACLTILYLHVARALGWAAEAVNFPVRPMLRLGTRKRIILDPYRDGRLTTTNELRNILVKNKGKAAEPTFACFEPLSSRALLVHAHATFKALSSNEDIDGALRATKILLAVNPDNASAWRDLGIFYANLGQVENSVTALETFLAKAPEDAGRYKAAHLLQGLKVKKPRPGGSNILPLR